MHVVKKIQFELPQIHELAATIIKTYQDKSKVLCFYGEMGAGKTTLIKSLVKTLGGEDVGSSPTFGIVNEYNYPDGRLLGYHFDFYRITDEMEALDLGLIDYLQADAWVFIEWPENISSFIPENSAQIKLEMVDTKTRTISLS